MKSVVAKKAEERTEAERAKEARAREIKNQFKVFARFYPELVDKHSVKYPIEDSLLRMMPALHGTENLVQKPQGLKVLVPGAHFEKLLYIFEFCNNFAEYLKI